MYRTYTYHSRPTSMQQAMQRDVPDAVDVTALERVGQIAQGGLGPLITITPPQVGSGDAAETKAHDRGAEGTDEVEAVRHGTRAGASRLNGLPSPLRTSAAFPCRI